MIINNIIYIMCITQYYYIIFNKINCIKKYNIFEKLIQINSFPIKEIKMIEFNKISLKINKIKKKIYILKRSL